MCCEVRPLLPLPIMKTVASVPCLLPLVYAKQSFCMEKGEDLNEEFFAVTDERFLTQQKSSLLICWDFVSKPCKPLRCLQTLAGRDRFFSNTEPLYSNCWQSLQIVCLQEAHLVPKCARKCLLVATTLFVSA